MLFRKDDRWMEELPLPDIRDWPVVDTDGNFIGYVEEIAVDRTAMKLEAVLTGPNERFPADDLSLGDGVVTVNHSVQWRVRARDDAATEYSSYGDAFRDHFGRVYSDADRSFNELEDAYRFGRRMAGDGDYVGLLFERAEEALRAKYASEGHRLSFHEAREAIRFAYSLTHARDVRETAGLEKVDDQILNPSRLTAVGAAHVGEMMAMGDPQLEQRR